MSPPPGTLAEATRAAVAAALARKLAERDGAAAQALQQRAQRWQQPCSEPATAGPAPAAASSGEAAASPLQALAALVDRLGRRPAPSLKAVARHQGTWARLRAEQRLRQAGARVPAKAGPLHSAQVVYRALLEMQQTSPAYLDALLAQVDTLIWLEQASGAVLPQASATTAGPSAASAVPGAKPGRAGKAGRPPAGPRSPARARR